MGSFIGAKDLKPDLVVISSMWNDLPQDSSLFNVSSELTENYIRLLFKSSAAPFEGAAQELIKLQEQILKAPRASEEFRQKQMEIFYENRIKDLILRIRVTNPKLPILLVTLPFGINDSFLDKDPLIKNLKSSDVFTHIYDKNFNIEHWMQVEKIQNLVSEKLAQKFLQVSVLNLSREYTENFGNVAATRILEFNYFTEDLMHFSPMGDAFVAERLENKISSLLNQQDEK